MRNLIWCLAPLIIAFGSCINPDEYKIKSLETNPDIAIPLTYGEVSIASILNSLDSTLVKIDSTGQVFVEFKTSLSSNGIGSLFNIDDINFDKVITLPANTYPSTGTDIELSSFSDTIALAVENQTLSEILFKAGTLNYQLSFTPANPNFDIFAQITFPDFVNQANNQSLVQNIPTGSGSTSLENHLLSMDPANQFIVQTRLILRASNQAVSIQDTEIDLNLSFQDLETRYVRGYFEEQAPEEVIRDILETDAFGSTLAEAEVTFADATIRLEIINEYGVPVSIEFINFAGQNDNGILNISTNPPSPITVPSPANMGESSSVIIEVTNGVDLLNFIPDIIFYDIQPRINVGAPFTNNNFIIDTSKISLNLSAEVPVAGSAKNIFIKDTIDIALEGIELSNISNAGIKVDIINEMPIDGRMQFYFLDSAGQVIDSLLAEDQRRFIPASEVDENGFLETPGVFDDIIELDPERLNLLFTAKSLVISASLTTSPQIDNSYPIVRFLSQYKLQIALGLRINLKVKVDF